MTSESSVGRLIPLVGKHDHANRLMAEVDFMNAMQAYKVSSGRMFPTWSEVLEVVTALGYSKVSTDS